VLESLLETCARRQWHVFCAHVRTNHVHLVLQTTGDIDRALGYLKARATYRLKVRHRERERFWTAHGSTRYIWSKESLASAMNYVANEQGEPMAVFIEQRTA
jgi:REP element-mobilizing transposase RayT